MKLIIGTLAGVGTLILASWACANPALLPKHPGYPGGSAVSPVTGEPLTSDAGQTNAVGEKALMQSAGAEDAHVTQNLRDMNNERLVEKQGAGQLPKVQGPQIQIEPPVKEGTKIGAERTIQ